MARSSRKPRAERKERKPREARAERVIGGKGAVVFSFLRNSGADIGGATRHQLFRTPDGSSEIDPSRSYRNRTLVGSGNIKQDVAAFEKEIEVRGHARDQAAVLYSLSVKMILMSPSLKKVITIRETRKELACPRRGTLYRALSKESKTAFGLSPVFSVHDELGQVRGPRSPLYEAIETASGAQEQPLSIIISTQAATDADLLSVLIDDALSGADPRTVCLLHTADPEMDPFSEEALRAANPAFGIFQNATETRASAEDARRMPSREAEFRNLILNQRIETKAPFIAKAIWMENADKPVPIDGAEIYGGLDLSQVSDLTAFVAVHKSAGEKRWSVNPMFWLPAADLIEKARTDRVPYDDWQKSGDLLTVPGRVIDYDYVAAQMWALGQRCMLRKIAFDRWGFAHFKSALLRAGFSEKVIEEVFVPFGQGFKDMSPAVRTLESMLLKNELRHGAHPLLTMCVANSVVVKDPAGNRKLTKETGSAKIDGAVALAMAVSVINAEDAGTSGKTYLDTEDLLVL